MNFIYVDDKGSAVKQQIYFKAIFHANLVYFQVVRFSGYYHDKSDSAAQLWSGGQTNRTMATQTNMSAWLYHHLLLLHLTNNTEDARRCPTPMTSPRGGNLSEGEGAEPGPRDWLFQMAAVPPKNKPNIHH